jgi:hypothetical protein
MLMNLVYLTYLHFEDGEDDYDYDEEEKGPALEIYGTDLTCPKKSPNIRGPTRLCDDLLM